MNYKMKYLEKNKIIGEFTEKIFCLFPSFVFSHNFIIINNYFQFKKKLMERGVKEEKIKILSKKNINLNHQKQLIVGFNKEKNNIKELLKNCNKIEILCLLLKRKEKITGNLKKISKNMKEVFILKINGYEDLDIKIWIKKEKLIWFQKLN